MSIFEYDKEKEEKKLRKAERECGREEGLQQGLQEGLKEGLKEWLQQGRMEERKSLLALIAKMSAGGDADQIATLDDPELINAMQYKYGIRYQEIQMNIQIFGTKKCNDTKKAERFFKERGIKYQFIDMKEKGMSKGEFTSVAQANGGLENMVNWEGKDQDTLALIRYIAEEDKLAKVLENPSVIRTPIVRNGKQSTIGYQPEVWKGWN